MIPVPNRPMKNANANAYPLRKKMAVYKKADRDNKVVADKVVEVALASNVMTTAEEEATNKGEAALDNVRHLQNAMKNRLTKKKFKEKYRKPRPNSPEAVARVRT